MKASILIFALALAGCATSGRNYTPVVDMQGRQQQVFAADLRDCQQYATQRADAATGAVVGALAAGLLGAFLAPRGYKNEVAGKTSVLGAIGGAGQANETQEVIIKRCLAGRGYSVLN